MYMSSRVFNAFPWIEKHWRVRAGILPFPHNSSESRFENALSEIGQRRTDNRSRADIRLTIVWGLGNFLAPTVYPVRGNPMFGAWYAIGYNVSQPRLHNPLTDARHKYVIRQKRSLKWYYDYYYYHTLVRVGPKIKIQNNNLPRHPCTHTRNDTEYLHINCRFTRTRYRRRRRSGRRRRVVTYHNLGSRTRLENVTGFRSRQKISGYDVLSPFRMDYFREKDFWEVGDRREKIKVNKHSRQEW